MNESGQNQKVVLAEPDLLMRKFMTHALRVWRKEIAIEYCRDQEGVLRSLESRAFSLLIVDSRLLREPAEPLQSLRRRGLRTPVILTCGNPPGPYSLDGLGPIFVLLKPFDLKELKDLLDAVLPLSKFREAPARSQRGPAREGGLVPSAGRIIGKSPSLRAAIEKAHGVASSEATVVLQGESGTGKELFAREIHSRGPRAGGPFVAVNCAALAETLLESELLGHEKAAFTGAESRKIGKFELAHGGTIFLDEMGDMSPALQAKLLRVLQERTFERVGGNESVKVDVRVIAATNRDLKRLVAEGTFREDLFWRLNVVTIHLPRLADRPEDIPLLAKAFLQKFAHRDSKAVVGVTPALIQALQRHPWRGNVRELENVIEHMVAFSKAPELDVKDLPSTFGAEPVPRDGRAPAKPRSRQIPRETIIQALARARGNRTKAAKLLGISRRQLYKLMRKYSIAQPARV